MNKSLKQYMLIIAFSALLIIMSGLPIVFLEYGNKRMINSVYAEDNQIDYIVGSRSTDSDFDALDRLLITKKSNLIQDEVAISWRTDDMSDEDKTKLVESVESQLTILSEKSILPILTFSTHYNVYALKGTYINIKNPDQPVKIIHLTIEFQDLMVNVYMDSETEILYDIMLIKKNGEFGNIDSLSESNFIKYIQQGSNITEKNGIVFSAYGMYQERTVNVFATSIDSQTNKHASYNFENLGTVTKVSTSKEGLVEKGNAVDISK